MAEQFECECGEARRTVKEESPEAARRWFLPRWAGLAGAAYLTDECVRRPARSADSQVTLFHFGVETDEALGERLAHVLEARSPAEVLPLLSVLSSRFDRPVTVKVLGGVFIDASGARAVSTRGLKSN